MKSSEKKNHYSRKIGSLLVNFTDPFEYENIKQFIRISIENIDNASVEESMKLLESEKKRLNDLQKYEKRLKNKGIVKIAGVDEVGRGPLAGPLIAASVMFDSIPYLPFVNDSKLLSEKEREIVYEWIYRNSLDVGIGIVTSVEIDRYNVHNASLLAMARALKCLNHHPEFVLVDGMFMIPDVNISQEAIVKGDRVSFTIACASIVAKVTRDRMMSEFDRLYPEYGFSKNKGYPTKQHIEALKKHGLSLIHRKSYSPVKKCINERIFPEQMILNI